MKLRKKNLKVMGVGVNDADYHVAPRVEGKTVICCVYGTWAQMLRRCYCKQQQILQPTYVGCKVVDQWLGFMEFRSWMVTQDYKGKALDKDLFGDGKLYSPDTCCFVPQWLNNLIYSGWGKTKLPQGVHFHKQLKRYTASIGISGKAKHVGIFASIEVAERAQKQARLDHVQKRMADYPDQRIKEAVLLKVAV